VRRFNVNILLRKIQIAQRDVYMPSPHHPPLAVRRTLRKLGGDLRDARKRRGLTAEIVAERAFTTRPTLQKIEAGDDGVSIGIYAAVLNALGLLDHLGQVADPSKDLVGQQLAAAALPTRVRQRSSNPISET
jgi:DNA-binding XRE family transcriptional regulator